MTIAIASSSRDPMTTRSGRMKSSMAEPSRRNSGFETTENLWRPGFVLRISSIWAPVPVGTVDFVMTTLYPFMCPAIVFATSKMNERSGEPSSFGGVPTAMKMTRERSMAPWRSLVKRRRPAFSFLWISSSRPGS